ncbi:SET1 [Acrasis kona]|uniref:SET1 n=1 Tax=Acrasis kona TaxID=1008807 RepID=A0AAW2YKR6_9EUKA
MVTWPTNVQYKASYTWDSRIPEEVRKKYCPTQSSVAENVNKFVIKRIQNKDHPANGQFGLFANKTIPPQTHIVDYVGKIFLDDDCDDDSQYLMRYADGLICDASKIGNEARMVNDFHGVAESPNVKYKSYQTPSGEKRIGYFTANKKIKKGEEILTSYGRGFNLSGE